MPKKPQERKPDAQWFKHRLRALGLQVKDAAEAFGLPPNKVWQMLAARRRVQPEELATWAKLLRAPMAMIFKRMDYPWHDGSAPVEGRVSASGRVTRRQDESDGIAAKIVAPYPESAVCDLSALVLEEPVAGYPRGTIFYYAPSTKVDESSFGRLALVTLPEGFGGYVGIPSEIEDGQGTLRTLDGRNVDLVQIISASPIRWIRTGK